MNLVLTVLAVAASVIGSGMAFPQALKLFRTRRTEGLSPTWIGVSMAINAWWTAYAIAESLWMLLPVSSVSLSMYAWIAVVFVRNAAGQRRSGLLVGVFGLGMAPLPVLIVAGWESAGIAIGLSYGLQLAPAVLAAFRTRELSGVSSLTWVLSFGEAILWLGYGVGVNDAALGVSGVVGIVLAGAILVRLELTGHRPFAFVRRRRFALS